MAREAPAKKIEIVFCVALPIRAAVESARRTAEGGLPDMICCVNMIRP